MRIALFFLVTTALAACKTQNIVVQSDADRREGGADSVFAYDPHYEHAIAVDDKITISIWGQDDLSVGSVYGIYNSNEVYGKWLLVDRQGHVELPKIGTFHVAGYTLPALKDTLRKTYARWIVSPVVDVKVLNKTITVLGEVRSPAVVPIDKDRNTLLELISRTGGFEFYADLRYIKVLRQQGEDVRVATIDLTETGKFSSKNIQLHPGDVVIVPSKHYKNFDKRIATIIPFTSTVTAAAIILGAF